MTLPELSYSHSDARLEDKAKFIEGVMGRKATVKSLEFPDMTVQVVGNTAIVRHLWVSQTELEGKVTDTKSAPCRCGRNRTAAGSSWRAPRTGCRSRHSGYWVLGPSARGSAVAGGLRADIATGLASGCAARRQMSAAPNT